MTRRSLIGLAVPLAAAALAVSACGGSSSSSSSSAAPASTSAAAASTSAAPAPHPDAECSQEALAAAAKHATGGSFGGVESFVCDSGWAVATGQMSDNEANLLFQDKDGVWMPVESQETCQAGGLPAKIADVVCS